MGIVFRQSLKTTIINFIGASLGVIITLIYVYALSPEQYGFIKNIINESIVIQLFILLGISGTVGTFIPRYKTAQKKHVLLAISFIIPFIVIGLFTIGYAIFKKQILLLYMPSDRPLINQYFYWLPILILFYSYITLLESYLYSQIKVAQASFSKEIILRIFTLVPFVLLFLKYISFGAFLCMTILSYIMPIIFMLYVSQKTKDFGFSLHLNVFSRAEYKDIIHFSWYHLLLGAALNMMGYIDSIMVASMDKNGLKSAAIYNIALLFISIMIIPYRAIIAATFTVLNKTYMDGDRSKLRELFNRSSINILIIAIAMFILIASNLNNCIKLLPKNKGYELAKPVVLILMIGRLIDMATGLNNELISITKFYKSNFYISSVLLFLLVFFCWLLIPRYGIYGAAWASSIALAIFNIIKFVFLWYKLRIQPFSFKSIVVVFCGLAAAAVGFLFPVIHQPIIDAVVRSTAIGGVYFGLLLWLKPSEDLTQFAVTAWTNKKLF